MTLLVVEKGTELVVWLDIFSGFPLKGLGSVISGFPLKGLCLGSVISGVPLKGLCLGSMISGTFADIVAQALCFVGLEMGKCWALLGLKWVSIGLCWA